MTRPQRVSRWFWGAYSALYDSVWDSPVSTLLADRIAARVGRPGRVVALACGTGLCVQGLDAATVLGIDYSESMARRALKRGRVRHCMIADAQQTPLIDRCADAVVVANLLHVHPDPAGVLTECARILSPGGMLVVSWPTDEADLTTVALAQRAMGWGRLRLVRAQVSAILVGLLSPLCQVYRARASETRLAVNNSTLGLGLKVIDEEIILGLQHLVVLAAP